MDKDIFSIVKRIPLPKKDFVVTGSGAMVARGFGVFHDIDVVVNEETYNMLVNMDSWETIKRREGFEVVSIKIDDVEIEASPFMHTWNDYGVSMDVLFTHAKVIEGVLFMDIQHLLNFKKIRMLEKDIHDIVLIEEYIKTHGI